MILTIYATFVKDGKRRLNYLNGSRRIYSFLTTIYYIKIISQTASLQALLYGLHNLPRTSFRLSKGAHFRSSGGY